MNDTPRPQGLYRPAKRFGSLIFTAGLTPRKDGALILTGQVDPEKPVSFYHDAARQAAKNALAAAVSVLRKGETLGEVLSMTVIVNAPAGYTLHTKIADLVSECLVEALGENGVGCRTAVGASSLPGDAPLEINLVMSICSEDHPSGN